MLVSTPEQEPQIRVLARQLYEAGKRLGLPLLAVTANISSARPAVVADGTLLPKLFELECEAPDPDEIPQYDQPYWTQTDLALDNALISILRCVAEPFFYHMGEVQSWRPLDIEPGLARRIAAEHYGFSSAIVAPIYMPGSRIGAVAWASMRPHRNIASVFHAHAAQLQMSALRFLSSCSRGTSIRAYRLTRREVQCLKLAAAGKTDGEIATIIDVAIPTVRFHLKKAGMKLGEQGRLRIVQQAVALGYVSIH